MCGVTSAVPHGGLVVALFKATNYMSLYFLCVMAGTALSIAIVLAFKRRQEKIDKIPVDRKQQYKVDIFFKKYPFTY